ncbi:gamma-glutamyltranspeptidase/glutathione hydrolase [Halopolyspora algeriensis]|uniref:Gamma-glutamyltranspeptidase/glutathione hydrolase n=1 Tax=Halopolyspora algeriensis TaxID=1500506 RepID=A0A368VUR1_9ACTN|nr:gamma-glutamyltransferase [Halopolyspora algeriensis]RCW45836.1 gamma-glutamyltranspeptidase/glutathione hydrolase [Halopolyspora algeriensis]TQM55251.1 gamma-glutamyltranspeptidase/glutathione hydrolase [Halopolyspora algeriensis]
MSVREQEIGPQRPAVLAGEGMVSSSHPAVSAAGAHILADGGNAVDAALAMAAMSWLVLPGQCGLGGDAFAVVREPDGSVRTVGGSGFGPDGGDLDFYSSRELTAVPLEGALAVAVPGAVAGLAALHAHGATRELSALWGRATEAAERGVPCTAKTRADIAAHADVLGRDPGAAGVLLPDGRIPEVGRRLHHPEFAATLRTLAKNPASFYTGDFAEQAVATLQAGGAPFSGDEWAACGRVVPEPALFGRYGGHIVHQTPLPTPGWMVLQQAAICDRWIAGMPWLDAEAVHVMAGAANTAFADRVQHCGSDTDSWRATMESSAIAAARDRIAFDNAPTGPVGAPDGDTTSMVAVDAEGRAVSLIHSLAFTFGARLSVPGTGVLLNNRLGRGAYSIPEHPNAVAPRRRPLHTLNAWIVTDEAGDLLHVGNTPGGDGQVQWNMQLLSHLIDHGCDPQQAVDAPRFTVFPGSDADVLGSPQEVRCESRLGDTVLERLRHRGHAVRVDGPWDAGGSALVISADSARGCLRGGADSRQEGVALGA